MWLLNCETFQLEPFEGDKRPPYAILSHRWEGKEVSFQDVMAGRHTDMEGWRKIRSCCEQAKREELEYVWADTCCIDKQSSAELSEAINSMYKWYKQAKVCYAYLADVVHPGTSRQVSDLPEQEATLPHEASEEDHFNPSELLAPERLEFYDRHWRSLGTKNDSEHRQLIKDKTGIPDAALENFEPVNYRIVEKMSWAAGRETSRIEDRTYSLLGLFEINMPLLYGEGSKAFERLQNELIRTSIDTTIYAWSVPPLPPSQMGPLASSPDCYQWDPLDDPLRTRYEYAEETSISKEGISGRFRVAPFCLEVLGASLGGFENIRGEYHEIIIFLTKIDHNLYSRILPEGRGYAVITRSRRPFHSDACPLITIRLEPFTPYSLRAIDFSTERRTYGLHEVAPGLLLSTGLSKRIENYGVVGRHVGRLFTWRQGKDSQNRPLYVGPGWDSSTCVLLMLESSSSPLRYYNRVIVRFCLDIAQAPTATAYFVAGHWYYVLWHDLEAKSGWYGKWMPEEYRDRRLTVSKHGNWKFHTARYTAKDREVLTLAFDEIDKEKANGTKIQQLGSDIKVAYFPFGPYHYFAFLALRDTRHCEKLPREWLYPPLEGLIEKGRQGSRWQQMAMRWLT